MKSWTTPGQAYNLQPLNELNDIELMDLDKRDYVKFKKEFEKIVKKSRDYSWLKPEFQAPDRSQPQGSVYMGGMSSDIKKDVIKAIEDTLKKLRIKSFDLRKNP